MTEASTPAQARVVDAATVLFSRHGVGGTSLQMIADELGVTKAAVYHQYRTKDEIVLAAAEAELDGLRSLVRAAEAEPTPERRRAAAIDGMVDLAVARGRSVRGLLGDPVVTGYFHGHEGFAEVMVRLQRLLVGGPGGREARLRTAMLVAAISGAVMHPFVADLDDATLGDQLRALARRFLAPPPRAEPGTRPTRSDRGN